MKTPQEVREELFFNLTDRKSSYSKKVWFRGAFLLFQERYCPIKLLFIPTKAKIDYEHKELNYGEMLLLEDTLDIDTFLQIVNSLGENREFRISSYQIKIPIGYFRSLNEDQNEITQQYGGYSQLSDSERKLLEETRSFPNSVLQQWPTKVYLFQFRVENELNNLYNQKSWEPMPLKLDLPAIPEFHAANSWWFGKDIFYLREWIIAIYLPDFGARIKNVVFGKDSFVMDIEEGFLKKENVGGKYYLEYLDLSSDVGDLNFAISNQIPIKDNVRRFYFVLYNKNDAARIDYRDYNWMHPYTDRSRLDIEYEQENIEYWITRGENERIEYKLEVERDQDNEEFLESVCSFSNTYGGQIFIGVDNNGNVKGLSENQINRYKSKLPDLIRSWIEPQVQRLVQVIKVRERDVIIVRIPKGDNQPYNYRDHGIYIRAGSTDRIAARDEIVSLAQRNKS